MPPAPPPTPVARALLRIVTVLGLVLALVGVFLLATWLLGAREAPRLVVGLALLVLGTVQLSWGVRRLAV